MADETNYTYTPETWSETTESSSSTTNQVSETQKTLNSKLLDQILAGLIGQMTDEEIREFAENLLRPQLNAELESAQQTYETTKLAKEQEIENLAAELQRAIEEQNMAYRQSMADVDTAALARGMGRSSYTLQTLANQGSALAEAIRQLTDENTRQSSQIQQQITQAAQQNAQTQGRLNVDYATNLAAKIQELKQAQMQDYNANYMTAVSEAIGSTTTSNSTTTGTASSNTVSGKASDPSASSSSSSGSSSGSSSTVSSGTDDVLTVVDAKKITGRYGQLESISPK